MVQTRTRVKLGAPDPEDPTSTPIVCVIDRATTDAVPHVSAELAYELGSQLQLVHVAREPRLLPSWMRRECRRRETGRRGQERLTEILCRVPAEVDACTRLAHGEPTKTIIELCEQSNAALLVIAAPAQVTRAAIGDRLWRALAARAPCPVVIVPNVADPVRAADAGESIVCGVDWSRESVKVALVAGDLASRLDKRLVVVQARGRQSRVLKKALAAVSGNGVTTVDAHPSRGVLEAVARTHRAALVFGAALGLSPAAHIVVVVPERAAIDPGSGHYELAAVADVG
ncbi:MAG: universal stress protein [Actinomycetota bacterium]|nr:universal stress protein [Actinomycetota bacterium]